MQFHKLRLAGFKSFVEPTELVIDSGCTGIVGPNGCGKSNLVEALRWVMGENSAKRMRGGEMEDVIFAGTSERPPRNLAEVSLHLHNDRRTAPPQFNDADEIDVVRRIERGAGSDYRVNAKSVRARDVQLLFADQAIGPKSPAMISQGRVGAIIGSKPQDRRLILEEAAGITGLHARRHEAELRLRGAETNLTRLEDVLGQMDNQLQALKKQARQATRYRNLSDLIRKAEAALYALRWRAAETREKVARATHEEADAAVRASLQAVTSLTTRHAEAADGLPELRQAEAAAAAALQRLVVERETLEAEGRRLEAQRADAARRLEQLGGDLAREAALETDARAALDRLGAERTELAAAGEGQGAAEAAARAALEAAIATVEKLDAALTALTEKIAADEAGREAAQARVTELGQRNQILGQRLATQQAEREKLEKDTIGRAIIEEAEAEAAAAEARLAELRAAGEAAEASRAAAEAALGAARDKAEAARAERSGLKAEIEALTRLLAAGAGQDYDPALDSITAAKGYEAALAAAFGDALTAALDSAAPIHWAALPPLANVPALPAGATPLNNHIKAPAQLARALALVGLVGDAGQGAALAAQLAPGQVLVSRDGAAWRWDGLVVQAGTPGAATIRLQQKNRLAELEGAFTGAAAAAEAADSALADARAGAEAARAAEAAARQALSAAYGALNSARDRHARMVQQAAATDSRIAALGEAIERSLADRDAAAAELAAARTLLEGLPDLAAARAELASLRTERAEARGRQGECQSALDHVLREADARRNRLEFISAEDASWTRRLEGAAGRVAEIRQRMEEAESQLKLLSGKPAELAARRDQLLDRISTAEAARGQAADLLQERENHVTSVARELKEAEAANADAREARAGAEAEVRAAQESGAELARIIAERLDCAPDGCWALAEIDPAGELPHLDPVQSRLERLVKEREGMGAVNLRAAEEAETLTREFDTLEHERADLLAAIGKLRQGIAQLNKEARERLLASFDTVDKHFQRLFVRLFGGGHAHLSLTEAEDPLEAGLEIYASPPGKRLQSLSLLSGGEQALTAIALIFGMFLTNPAPICVLDEVDAPLDDNNVDRFCALLGELAHDKDLGTRFLVITHHRMTMARMDRLYGVTMAERGVSQLVSVDLRRAETMVDQAAA